MNKIINLFMEKMDKVANIFILNIVFVITCIPVITWGAAFTALYRVTLLMARNEEGYIVKGYLKEFKASFKKITPTWLVFLVIGLILLVDNYAMKNNTALNGNRIYSILIQALFIVYLMVLSYLFPVTAYFENTRINAVKNAFLMAVSYLPATLFIMAMNFIPFLVMYISPTIMIYGMPIWCLFGFALIALVNSKLFRKIFDRFS